MTGIAGRQEDEGPAVADNLGFMARSRISSMIMAVSLLIVGLLTWITVGTIRGGADDGKTANKTTDFIGSISGDQTASDEVSVSIGVEGHPVVVACFLPTATTPPLVVFASSAPSNLDMRAEVLLIDGSAAAFQTVAEAERLRPGEQRQAVPRTLQRSTVVIEERVVDCLIQSVQSDRQIVRFS